MSNPFQDQFLKAGLVNKKQVQQANQEKSRNKKKQRQSKEKVVDEVQLKIKKTAEDKAKHDQSLNRQRDQQARNKAISAEINQLIIDNCIERNESYDIIYNFEHRKKINRIYINTEIKQQLLQGSLGIARIEGRYELIPAAIAEKIKQRNEKRVIMIVKEQGSANTDKNDPYADYQVPDDLIW